MNQIKVSAALRSAMACREPISETLIAEAEATEAELRRSLAECKYLRDELAKARTERDAATMPDVAANLWAILDEVLEAGEITGGMYRERTLEGEKIGEDSPMWYGPMVRNGACMSAKELAVELLACGFRGVVTTDG